MAATLKAKKQAMVSGFRKGLKAEWNYTGNGTNHKYMVGKDESFELKNEMPYNYNWYRNDAGEHGEKFPQSSEHYWEMLKSATDHRVLSYEQLIPDVLPPPPFSFS